MKQSDKLTDLFLDFVGENAMVADYTIAKVGGAVTFSHFILQNGIPIIDTHTKDHRGFFRFLNVAKKQAQQAAIDAYNLVGDDWEEMETWEEDETYLGQYIGTVFSLCPSGKYYTPFANSNVDIMEATKDMYFYETLERLLNDKEYWLQSGEGDPCDLFVCKIKQDNSLAE